MTELAPGIHSLGHHAGGRVHAFLIDHGGELSLVDTLFETDARLVLAALQALGRNATDLKRIAITHAHRSHLGGLATLKRASGATIFAHAWEADIIEGNRVAQPITLLPKQSLKLIPFQLGLRLNRPRHVPCPVDEQLTDGSAFGPLQVLHAAGHSPGHLAIPQFKTISVPWDSMVVFFVAAGIFGVLAAILPARLNILAAIQSE